MLRTKVIIPILFFIIILLLPGCEEPPVYDYDAFLTTSAYADEIIPAVEATLFDLRGWYRDSHEPKRIEWFIEKRDILISISNSHLTDSFPSYEEIKGWQVPVQREGERWTVEGEELADTLEEMHSVTDDLIKVITEIVESEGGFSSELKEEVRSVYGRGNRVLEKMERLFYNKDINTEDSD